MRSKRTIVSNRAPSCSASRTRAEWQYATRSSVAASRCRTLIERSNHNHEITKENVEACAPIETGESPICFVTSSRTKSKTNGNASATWRRFGRATAVDPATDSRWRSAGLSAIRNGAPSLQTSNSSARALDQEQIRNANTTNLRLSAAATLAVQYGSSPVKSEFEAFSQFRLETHSSHARTNRRPRANQQLLRTRSTRAEPCKSASSPPAPCSSQTPGQQRTLRKVTKEDARRKAERTDF